jgi:methylenetetrahydrofolate dehydrogenase (NADP+)/methenyltetrahydrofolate cyclohydrolase
MAYIISGTEIAGRLRRQVAEDVASLAAQGIVPGLAVVLVGEDPASAIYVRRKIEQCIETGIRSLEYRLNSDCEEASLLDRIERLNKDPAVHGILVQLPLPRHIDSSKVLNAIDPGKDVDGFHPVNVGRLASGTGGFIPCTPFGCMLLLETVVDDFSGKLAVVIGRSNIVGKPVALLLLERGCTVIVTHSRTCNLPEIVKQADIVVAAVGRPELVKGNWIKPGAVVVDVGINRVCGERGRPRIVGDVAFGEMEHAAAITPVPGGVGPMTIACLLANTVKATARLLGNELG